MKDLIYDLFFYYPIKGISWTIARILDELGF